MRVISYKTIHVFARRHADASGPLDDWYDVATVANWKNIADVRRSIPHADPVKVASGNTVTVFNSKGKHFRLVTSIKYRWRLVYLLRIMTHAEYSNEQWKDQL